MVFLTKKIVDSSRSSRTRRERFLLEYSQLCHKYEMLFSANHTGEIFAVTEGYNDGIEVLNIDRHLKQLRDRQHPEHLEIFDDREFEEYPKEDK